MLTLMTSAAKSCKVIRLVDHLQFMKVSIYQLEGIYNPNVNM